jgi:AhpD family alkylhydroperoxidase
VKHHVSRTELLFFDDSSPPFQQGTVFADVLIGSKHTDLGEETMNSRIDYTKASPAALKAMYALQAAVNSSGLEPSLLELIKLRVSQINGCAFCIDLHFREARAKGEKEERLYLLDAWRESPVYTDRERAALAWAEAVTLVSQTHVPDEVFAEAHKYFDESELVNLTLAVVAINGWNRFSISFRVLPLLGKQSV